MLEQLKEWDRELFIYLNGLGIESYDNFWITVTTIQNWIPLYITFFILYFVAFHWKKALFTSLFILATALSTYGFTNVVKNFFLRLRPNNQPEIADVIRILQTPDNYSFFSGHSAVSTAAALFLILSLKDKYPWIWVVLIWPLLFMLSRIYVGVHYPGDVLVGAAVGIIFAITFFMLYQRSGKRFI